LLDFAFSLPEAAARVRTALQGIMTREQIAEAQHESTRFASRLRPGSEPKRPEPLEAPRFRATGSGFFITDQGHLLTCYHVVEGASQVSVRMGSESVRAQVVRLDAANDLALLRVTGPSKPLSVGSSRKVALGESVFTVGYPNIGIQGVSPKLTRGNISSVCGMLDDPRHFQISVPVQKGSSGGPLVSESGFVVGIITAKLDAAAAFKSSGDLPQNVNYALRSDCIRLFLGDVLPEPNRALSELESERPVAFVDLVSQVTDATVLVEAY
jgi:S1-C subfamily serine protease